MNNFATIADIENLWRPIDDGEATRATALLPVVAATLRQEAINVGKDLDAMISNGEVLPDVVRSVVVDVVARTLMTPTSGTPMTQMSESALGYTVSGTYLSPGGGLFIKKTELARLGLHRQRIGVVELYGRNH